LTYTDDVQPILQANCTPCHSTDNRGGHNAAAEYADAFAERNAIIAEIEAGDMPQACMGGDPGSGGACLSEADLATIEQWVEDGALE
jgi:hypothetical protein